MGDLYAMLQRAVFVALFMLLVVRAQGDAGRDGLDVRDGAQTKLNEVIDQVLALHGMEYGSSANDTDDDLSMQNKGSAVYRVCGTMKTKKGVGSSRYPDGGTEDDVKNRVGCLNPDDTRHIFNAMVSLKKLVLFKGSDMAIPGGEESLHIPSIDSVIRTVGHSAKPVTSTIVLKSGDTFQSNPHCKRYFQGTLHVIGLQAPTNVYHTISDNYIPMITQILTDAYTQSPYLKKPRMAVIHKVSAISGGHFHLQSRLYSGGVHKWAELDGTCFERIVWGRGPHAIFHFHMAKQRRMASDFARIHASMLFDLQAPALWREEAKAETQGVKGMKVVLYTRGESGQGRSLANEAIIIQTLQQAGVRAVKCCDYVASNSVATQLSLAYHADVLLGMHGAALVHGVFSPRGVYVFELKTLYAFDAVLFALVADAREGTHVQIDIRSYFLNRVGHKAADVKLATRCVEALEKAVELTGVSRPSSNHSRMSSQFVGQTYTSHSNADSRENLGMAITGATNMTTELSHYMGPRRQNCPSECELMVMTKLSKWSGSSKALRDAQCVVGENFVSPNIKMVHTEDVVKRRTE